ncbi:unnamed protein product [marine sediment metagenome]|uniref:Uncharacterized protein n=1 Tax=marine sediment metagenome TaxID=412755 RepID=X0ZAT2_9ZZZZ
MVDRTFEIEYIKTLIEIFNKYFHQWENHNIESRDIFELIDN